MLGVLLTQKRPWVEGTVNCPCQWFLDTGCILEPPGQLKILAPAHTQTSKCLKASMVDSDV